MAPSPSPPAAPSPSAQAQAQPSAAVSSQRVSLTSAYVSTAASFAPIWAAKDGGYFDQEGLDVTLTRMAGQEVISAMISQEVPVVFIGGQPVVSADLGGAQLVLVAGFSDELGNSIYVDPSIASPDQLKGKVIGVTALSSASDTAAVLGLRYLGLDGQVTIVASGGPPETLAAMQAGQIQGGVFSPPDTFQAEQLGYHELINVADTGATYASAVISTSRPWAQAHPDVLVHYLRGLLEGVHRLVVDKPFGMQVIGQYTGTTDPTILSETYDYYVGLWKHDGTMSPDAVQETLGELADQQPAAQTATPDQFIDTTYVDQIKASGLIDQLWGPGG